MNKMDEGIESKDVYIRIEPSESVESKKVFLESLIETIELLKEQADFKKLKNEEIKLRNEVSKKIKEAKELLNDLLEILPKEKKVEKLEVEKLEVEKPEKAKKIKIIEKEKPKSKFDKELEDVRERLAKLS